MKAVQAPLYVSPRKASEMVGVTSRTITNWCQIYEETKGAAGLRSHKVKGRSGRRGNRLIKVSDLIAYIEKH